MVRKRGEVHESLMNDAGTSEAAVIAIQEPQARMINEKLLTTPMSHHGWTKMVPSTRWEGRWAIRSMIWIKKNLESEQVPVQSPDLTVALVRLHDRVVLVASVYVEGGVSQALVDSCNDLRGVVLEARRNAGGKVDVVIGGDFNRHDQRWGGDDVSLVRQGEADEIINMMNELSLCSWLPRGTKTWRGGEFESTIDLTLTSEELAATVVKCGLYDRSRIRPRDHRDRIRHGASIGAPAGAPSLQECTVEED